MLLSLTIKLRSMIQINIVKSTINKYGVKKSASCFPSDRNTNTKGQHLLSVRPNHQAPQMNLKMRTTPQPIAISIQIHIIHIRVKLELRYKQTSKQPWQQFIITNSKPVISQPIQPIPPPSKSTNSFLNVSLQFTNSFTMKIMAEPHKSNVKIIRNRTRQYKNSLVSYIK